MFSKIPARRLALATMLVGAVLLAGCATQGLSSVFTPRSSNARLIYNLALTILGVAAVVFVVVEGMLLYSVIRFRRKPGEDELPAQVGGSRRLEIAWTLAPAVVLAVVLVISLRTLRTVGYLPTLPTGAANDPTALHVTVVGHQWWWEFDYPDLGIVTAGEMHVPVNTVVDLNVESADVIHSYWTPQLGGKIDAIPGTINHTWFDATQTGTYHGQCAEFCGIEHAKMQLDVIVESSDQFQLWVQGQQAPVAAMTGEAAKGEQVFLNGPCVACHTINGTKAQGKIGPNLTHFAIRQYFAGATVLNTPGNMARWLANPQEVKPGNLMPDLHLSQDQINELVAFIESLN